MSPHFRGLGRSCKAEKVSDALEKEEEYNHIRLNMATTKDSETKPLRNTPLASPPRLLLARDRGQQPTRATLAPSKIATKKIN
jgi:hypothetical protein